MGPVSPEIAFVPKPRLIVHSIDSNTESTAMHQGLQSQYVNWFGKLYFCCCPNMVAGSTFHSDSQNFDSSC